jgi:hypothetical protein
MYFFDIEDYKSAGFFGRNYSGSTVDKLAFVVDTPVSSPWGQQYYSAYSTFRATRDAHYKSVNEYYLSGINVARIEDRVAMFNNNKTFCEKAGLLEIKSKEFWGMMGSFAFKRLFDDEIIANGDIVSVKHQYNLSEEEKANGHLFLFNYQGDNETPSYYAFIQPEGTPTNLQGQMNFSNSIEAGDLFTIKYTQFDVNIYNEYKTALQELMAAEKALIVSIDGEQTIIG